jgi:hypothetical protein
MMKRSLPYLLACLLMVGVLPALAQKKQAAAGGTFKDVLVQYQGKTTNLGTLKKVASDYLVFEAETDTTTVPIAMVQSVKVIKTEEGETPKVEIKLLSKE